MSSEGDRGAPRPSTAPSQPGPEDATNRRVSDRYDVTWAVDCQTEDTFLYASIRNISAMGIFVRTIEPLAVGTRVTLRFAPPNAAESFVLHGDVQWINRDVAGSPNPGMGIRFIELTPENRERIVDVIHTIAYLRDDPVKPS